MKLLDKSGGFPVEVGSEVFGDLLEAVPVLMVGEGAKETGPLDLLPGLVMSPGSGKLPTGVYLASIQMVVSIIMGVVACWPG